MSKQTKTEARTMAIKKEERCRGGGSWRQDCSPDDAHRRELQCNICRRMIGARWVRYVNGHYQIFIQHHKAKVHDPEVMYLRAVMQGARQAKQMKP